MSRCMNGCCTGECYHGPFPPLVWETALHTVGELIMLRCPSFASGRDRDYGLEAHSLSVALHTKFSAGAASTALALGKAYAATGEEKYAEAAELYLGESLMSYKAALGMDHPKAIHALEYFSKWLGRVGKRKQAYDLLKESFKSQQDPCSDFNKLAVERLYIMGCICLAEEKIEEAYQLLSKCMQIQSAIYGPCHKKCKKVQELLDMLKIMADQRSSMFSRFVSQPKSLYAHGLLCKSPSRGSTHNVLPKHNGCETFGSLYLRKKSQLFPPPTPPHTEGSSLSILHLLPTAMKQVVSRCLEGQRYYFAGIQIRGYNV
ncbi:Tetratricopeptide repeat protein 23-like [Varanus komodoensis]|nr:Tetratricopeptide repeat protein 23-like [Varanus komodoensis]